MRAFLCFIAGFAAAQQDPPPPIYKPDSVVTQLDEKGYDAMVTDLNNVYLVEFFADWCGHCRQFASSYERVAKNMGSMVKVVAVNEANNKPAFQANSVQSFPTIKLFLPETTKNPYTGKKYKTSIDYKGSRTAKALVAFINEKMPNNVQTVTDSTLDGFMGSKGAKALLITEKNETGLMFKSLALAFKDRLTVGEVQTKETKVVEGFEASEFPALFVIDAEGKKVKHEGDLKYEAITEFFSKYAAEAKPAEAEEEDKDFVTELTEVNYEETVEKSKDAWLIAVAKEGEDVGDLAKMGMSLIGQAKVGKVDAGASAALAEKLKVKKTPAFVTFPHGTGKKSAKNAGVHKDINAAKKGALESLPSNLVERVTSANFNQFIGTTIQVMPSKAAVLLFSDKNDIPPMFRALSMQFEGEIAFAMLPASDQQMTQQFQIDKTPAVMLLFPDPNKMAEGEGNVQLSGAKFTPQVHGAMNYGNIAQFVSQFLEQAKQMFGEPGAEGQAKPQKKAEPMKKKEEGPPTQLTAANWEEVCEKKGGLCGIALLDGAPSNAEGLAANLKVLEKVRDRKAGGPVNFMWLDATCHSNWLEKFELSDMDLPTMIVLSPTKLKYGKLMGTFEADNLGIMSGSVATGRQRTDPISEVPSIADVDCSTVKRGADAVVEEEPLDEDFLAEILAEEKAKEEALKAELKEQGVEVSPQGKQSKPKEEMTKLEQLEAEIETCDSMDLMCEARNEKTQKLIDKEKALQEKLKKIADKKKKAKKKAKKAAAKK